jgi:hypothetical protein
LGNYRYAMIRKTVVFLALPSRYAPGDRGVDCSAPPLPG